MRKIIFFLAIFLGLVQIGAWGQYPGYNLDLANGQFQMSKNFVDEGTRIEMEMQEEKWERQQKQMEEKQRELQYQQQSRIEYCSKYIEDMKEDPYCYGYLPGFLPGLPDESKKGLDFTKLKEDGFKLFVSKYSADSLAKYLFVDFGIIKPMSIISDMKDLQYPAGSLISFRGDLMNLSEDGKGNYRKALQALFDRQYDIAEEALQAIPELERSCRCQENLGIVYLKQGKTDDAESAFSHAIELCPNSFEDYRLRGIARMKKGSYKEAIEDFVTTESLLNKYKSSYNITTPVSDVEQTYNGSAVASYHDYIESIYIGVQEFKSELKYMLYQDSVGNRLFEYLSNSTRLYLARAYFITNDFSNMSSTLSQVIKQKDTIFFNNEICSGCWKPLFMALMEINPGMKDLSSGDIEKAEESYSSFFGSIKYSEIEPWENNVFLSEIQIADRQFYSVCDNLKTLGEKAFEGFGLPPASYDIDKKQAASSSIVAEEAAMLPYIQLDMAALKAMKKEIDCSEGTVSKASWFAEQASGYYDAEDYENAAAYYRAALFLEPRDAGYEYNLAQSLKQAGRTAEAVAHYYKYIYLAGDAAPDKQDVLDEIASLTE